MKSFDEFWPYYLRQHQNRRCRQLHYLGSAMAIGTLLTSLLLGRPRLLLLMPLLGYIPAWVGHFFFEGNRPATFKHPYWSLLADFKMITLAFRGKNFIAKGAS